MKRTIYLLLLATLMFSHNAHSQCVECSGSTSNGNNASAIGSNNTADGAGSIAIGTDAHTGSVGTNTLAIGAMVESNSPYSFVFGTGAAPQNGKRLVNNYPNTLMIGFNSTKPTLFISTSATSFEYNKTGKIAIGNVVNQNGQMDPLAKLHLRADEGEEASFFIEPNSWSGGDFANLFLGNFYHGITADTNQGLHFLSQKNYLFGAGNVGLGVEEPKAKLHVDGDILFESAMQGFVMKSEDGHCWKGIISNTGILEFQEVDCTTFTMAEETPETEHNGVFVYPNPSNGSFVVEYTGNKNELRLEVTSVNGALLGTYPIQKGKNTIALPEISQQLVVVTAYTTRGKLVSAHKIMVSR
ncbi:MAG: hypothetical protein K9G61_08665 [Bacteroidales bacterium]|nr:hypothetical protein [Bacteroidales bacterium]